MVDNSSRPKDLLPLIEDLMRERKFGQNIVVGITENLEDCVKTDLKTTDKQFLDPNSEIVERKLRELIQKKDLNKVLELLENVKQHVKKT